MMPNEDLQYAARTLSCSANAQACVSLDFMPCRPAQLKAVSSVQTKHRFVVQKEGPRSTFHMGVERCQQRAFSEAFQFGGKQATDHKPSRPARPHHRGLFDAVIHPRSRLGLTIGVSPMQASTRAA